MKNPFRKFFESKLKLAKGTRFASFLFIGSSVLIAAGVLFAANMYYNIDTGQIVMEEVQNVTKDIIISGANQALKFTGGTSYYVGLEATTTISTSKTYYLPAHDVNPPSADYVLTWQAGDQLTWKLATSTGGVGDITAVGNVTSGDAFTSGGTQGTSLWFYDAEGRGQLTIANLTGARTYTLPDTSGTVAVSSTAPITLSAAGVIGLTSPLATTYGGTGTSTSPTAGGMVYGTGSTYGISAAGTSGQALVSGGTGIPTWFNPTTGGVIFAGAGGVLSEDNANFFWDDSTNRLGIGTNSLTYPLEVKGAIRTGIAGTSGQLRIYSEQGGTDYEVIFNPTSTMVANTTYYLPPNTGSNNYVLTTDGTGVLTWKAATGTGAVIGSGTAGKVSRWKDSTELEDSSIVDNYTGTALTIDSAGTTTIAYNLVVSGSGGVSSALYTGTGAVTYTSGATTTISSVGSNDIILDPASGKITLGSGDYIQTASGYEIGKQNTEILREMIPIFGFDLPAQTATTSYVKISRTIQDYPFIATTTGTTRIHKFVIRYTDNLLLASTTDWRVATTTGAAYSTFTLGGCDNSALDSGIATTTGTVAIPTDGTDWWLEVKSQPNYDDNKIKVFQIFLAAYDRIN